METRKQTGVQVEATDINKEKTAKPQVDSAMQDAIGAMIVYENYLGIKHMLD